MTQDSTRDFFISYTQADLAWAEWIAWKLEEAGYTIFLQAWDFAPASNFVLSMHKATRLAKRTIAVLSPDYLTSRYAQAEWAAAFRQDPTSEHGLLLPVLVRPCVLDGLLASIVYIDLTDLGEVASQTLLIAKVTATRAKPSISPGFPGKAQKSLAFPGKKSVLWNVPYARNFYFTGRHRLLEALHYGFTITKLSAQAINGLGGMGKTQLAIEYAYRYEYTYRYVLWVNATSSESLLNDFVALAVLLNAPGYDSQQQLTAVKAVQGWLAAQNGWVLILDNADEIAMVRGFLPTRSNPDGHILLTTRAQATRAVAQPFAVDKMERDEGVSLLLRRTGVVGSIEQLAQASIEDLTKAASIVEVLDGLPLALDQAGGYIEETGCSLAEYLQLYQTHRSELLSRASQLSADYPATVATTWALAFQRIGQENPHALSILQFCAFLAPDTIPEELITTSYAKEIPDALILDDFTLNAAIEVLRRYSLIGRNAQSHTLTIHRVVQAVVRDSILLETQQRYVEQAVKVLNKILLSKVNKTWAELELYISHAYVCAGWIEYYTLESEDAMSLLEYVGTSLYNYARYVEAEQFYKQTLKLGKKLSHGIPEIYYKLGKLYHRQGRYQEAESCYQQALGMFNEVHDIQSLIVLQDLGLLCEEQGRYQEAEGFFQQALDHYKGTNREMLVFALRLDQQHVIATRLGIVTKLYRDHSDPHELEQLYQDLLDGFEETYGTEHPLTATLLHEFAWYRRWQGVYEEAESLYHRALNIRENLLGNEHTDTAETLYYLAELKRQQGEIEIAEKLLQRTYSIYSKVLGDGHMSTGAALHELARLYETQGRNGDAEQFYIQALTVYENVQGREHFDIAMVLHEIARVYEVQSKYDSSIQLELRALNIYEKTLGIEPQHTIPTLRHLAILYQAQNNYEQAITYYQRALAIQEKTVGIEQPDTRKTMSDYAALLRIMGRESEAVALEARMKSTETMN